MTESAHMSVAIKNKSFSPQIPSSPSPLSWVQRRCQAAAGELADEGNLKGTESCNWKRCRVSFKGSEARAKGRRNHGRGLTGDSELLAAKVAELGVEAGEEKLYGEECAVLST